MSEPQSSAPRGIVIVDTCALFDLNAPIAPLLKKNGVTPALYLDTLRFLGMNGYRIIIPEMVALEAGSMNAQGYDVGRLFHSRDADAQAAVIKPFLKRAALPPGSLEKDADGIEIMGNTGPQAVDTFCHHINAIDVVKNRTQASRLRGQARSIGTDYEGARNALRNAFAENKKNFGDDAILSLLKKHDDFRPQDNVMVLTNDGGLLNRLHQQSPTVLGATPAMFIHMLGASNVAPIIGFSANASPEKLGMDLYAGRRNLNGKAMGKIPNHAISRMAASPFAHALTALGNEIHQRLTYTESGKDAPPSHAERYSLPSPYKPSGLSR